MSEQAPSPWDPPPGDPEPAQRQPEQQQPVPPGAFPAPPGTQYGAVQYGGGMQYGGAAQYGPGQQAPGQYGQPFPPYPAAPYGYGAPLFGPPQTTSGMAIASLVLGICGFFCVTPFVGLGLGIAALVQTSKTGRPGKGMAIAGVILSSAWILLLASLIATGHFHGTDSGPSTGPGQGSDGTST